MATKYNEVDFQVLQHSRDNDDVVAECLNLFALLLNSGEYQEWGELHETKMKLNQAFIDHEILLKAARENNEHHGYIENIYEKIIK